MVPARITHYASLCFQGCGLLGLFYHMWWTCPVVQPLWVEVKLFSCRISPYPKYMLLNIRLPDLFKFQFYLMVHFLIAAKQAIDKA